MGAAGTLALKARFEGTDAAEYHGDCLAPLDMPLRGVQSIALAALRQWEDDDTLDYADGYGLLGERRPPKTRMSYVRVRCRKCSTCLKAKQRLWAARAQDEVRWSPRSWFGTLTISPDRRFWAQAVAERRVATTRNESFCDLTAQERTQAIARELNPEITRWLKRVRKQSAAKLRYLLVCEPHKDGFPHFHMLLHEQARPCSKRILESQWTYGFSNWRLIPPDEVKQVGYVCKYIAKSAQTRVRASRHYGRMQMPTARVIPDARNEVTEITRLSR